MGNKRGNKERNSVLKALNDQILTAETKCKEQFDWFLNRPMITKIDEEIDRLLKDRTRKIEWLSRQPQVAQLRDKVEDLITQREAFTAWDDARKRYQAGWSEEQRRSRMIKAVSINIRVTPNPSSGEAGCDAWRNVAHALSWRILPGITDLRERDNVLPQYEKSYSRDDRNFSISLTCRTKKESIVRQCGPQE